jgi:hypothetical protein
MRWIVYLAVFAVCTMTLAAQEVVLHSGTSEIPYLANLPIGTLQPGQYEYRATLLQGNAADQKPIAVTPE